MLKRFLNHEKGITGLETAIILIAFVVVAAVFAYTTLSAGLFSTQKSQEAVYAGLTEARSTLELKGGVIATAHSEGASGTIKQLSFTVSGVLGGEPIDFTAPSANSSNTGTSASDSSNKVVISYVDKDQHVNDLYWTLTKLGDADDDSLLEQNEKFKITIGNSDNGTGGGNLIDALTTDLSVNKTFSLIVSSPIGAVLEIERTTPAYIDTIMNLHYSVLLGTGVSAPVPFPAW
jgi:archaeal flagellin FlaB